MQCIRIIEAGADFIRLTAQGTREAENLAVIKKELRAAGFEIPLIADIHFNPAAAITAARVVEKVRINPGNYADKRASFSKLEYTEKEYNEELERIHEKLIPLINTCRENNTVIRVGINHGSLSDRIMTRFGNTPEGMVASASEFINIFRSENFNNLVLSMKSSDTVVVYEANRLLVRMMVDKGYTYPVHLGVTEAGEGIDGRVRSAAGIGALISEGIGDTVRVSLSEEPEEEIPVAKEIVNFLTTGKGRVANPAKQLPFLDRPHYKPLVITTRDGSFLDENNEPFNEEILTISADTLTGAGKVKAGKMYLNASFQENNPVRLAIDAASLLGRFFILKRADGICISNKGSIKSQMLKDISFAILQASEARITRPRYISCPTCGRTRFDLQGAVKKVKAATAHFTGLKIAIMGCVVNGPGEMAGADYGYVGAAPGKVHIYRGKNAVLRNIPENAAIKELLKIIEADQKQA